MLLVPSLLLAKRATAEDLGASSSSDLSAWLFLQLFPGNILLPILILTFLLSRTIPRCAALVNVCCTWVLSSIASLLLLYAGRQTGTEPSTGLCITQTALLGGAFPMTSVATVVLAYSTWTSRYDSVRSVPPKKVLWYRVTRVLLLTAPYLTWALFSAIGAKLAVDNPDLVSRDQSFFYCSIDYEPYNSAVTKISALFCLGAVACCFFRILRVHCVRRYGESRAIKDISFFVRVCIYVVYMLAVTVADLFALQNTNAIFPDMFMASMGMATFLIFALQLDVLRAWLSALAHPLSYHRRRTVPSSPAVPRGPYSSFDLDLMNRTDSDASEKARLEALRAYYAARVRGEGLGVQIIDRPEDAFVANRYEVRRSSVDAFHGPERQDGRSMSEAGLRA